MKRLVVLVFSPLVLFALEPVNLIKDAGFEKDSDVWLMRSKADGVYDSTIIHRHDPDSAYTGSYCSSIDERIKPWPSLPNPYSVVGNIYQIIMMPKYLTDLDSFSFFLMSIFAQTGNKRITWTYGSELYFTTSIGEDLIVVSYVWLEPGSNPAPDTPNRKYFSDTIADEGSWCYFQQDLKKALIDGKGLSGDLALDTFFLYSVGCYYFNNWYAQKAFFDDIRLTGYADYDVGVKEILSGDSVWAGIYYKPVARIKSFGREAADDFLAIAEIRQGESLVWADTIPYTLPADTEDTLEFDSFPVPNALDYTLTVRTEMFAPGAIDESDEDDQMSKPLYGTAIAENLESQALTLEVQSFTANPRVAYSLPQGQFGIISVYDAAGRREENREVQGSGVVGFPSALSSGVYFVKLGTNRLTLTKKTIILN